MEIRAHSPAIEPQVYDGERFRRGFDEGVRRPVFPADDPPFRLVSSEGAWLLSDGKGAAEFFASPVAHMRLWA